MLRRPFSIPTTIPREGNSWPGERSRDFSAEGVAWHGLVPFRKSFYPCGCLWRRQQVVSRPWPSTDRLFGIMDFPRSRCSPRSPAGKAEILEKHLAVIVHRPEKKAHKLWAMFRRMTDGVDSPLTLCSLVARPICTSSKRLFSRSSGVPVRSPSAVRLRALRRKRTNRTDLTEKTSYPSSERSR